MHEDTSCKVIVDDCLSDSFKVESGVIQGGILSPLLFVLVMDFVMRKVKAETKAGMIWEGNGKVLDLDYTDDIVMIFKEPEERHRILRDCLESKGPKIALVINSREAEVVNMNLENTSDCAVECNIRRQSNKFKYLNIWVPYLPMPL